jgi:uncharacterized protein (TIGR02996 family)
MADVALAQLVSQDATSALRAALSTWRETFHPEVGRWVEVLGARLVTPLDELPLKKGERAQRLAELATTADDAQRSAVLQAFEAFARDATGALVWPAVEAWAEVEPDPRVARMALRVLSGLEHDLTAKLWRRLVGCVERHGDTGVAHDAQPYLETLRARGGGWGFSVERFENVLGKLTAKRKPGYVDAAVLAQVKAALERGDEAHTRARKAEVQTEAAMLEAIVAAPDDDGPRLVYADWLSERRHPLGEFITLQVGRAGRRAGKDAREREARLLAGNRKELLGPFDGVVAKQDLVFERGFVVECVAVQPLPVHPLTRLLRHVTFEGRVGEHVRLDGLVSASGPPLLMGLAELPLQAPALKRWRIFTRTPDLVASSLEHAKLSELELRASSESLDAWLEAVFATPCGQGLRAMAVATTSYTVLQLSPARVPRTLERFSVSLPYLAELTFTRVSADGFALECRVEANALGGHRLVIALEALLPALPTISTKVSVRKADLLRLRASLAAISARLGTIEWLPR